MRGLERKAIVLSRFSAAAAVIGSLAGAFLMFVLGLLNVYEAFAVWTQGSQPDGLDKAIPRSSRAVVSVIESLDRFLIAIVLLYFGYGVYSLIIRSEQTERTLGLPQFLHVDQIGQLKQVVAEVIIVVLFVLFLRNAMQAFQHPSDAMNGDQALSLLVLPVSILLLALSLRLVELHPKPRPPSIGHENGGSGLRESPKQTSDQ